MNIDVILSVFSAFTAWTALYVGSRLIHPSQSWEWHCRCVTLLHAVVITGLSGFAVLVHGPWPFTEPAGPNTALQHWICVVTLGYFIFDFIWCLYFNTTDKIMLFHHVLGIFGNAMVLARGINGCEMMATLVGTEITNPILQTRWFLQQYPWYKGSNLAVAIDISFIVVFTIMRLCVGSVLLYTYLIHPRPDWLGRIGAISIYSVGWIFWFLVVGHGMKKYGHKPALKDAINGSPSSLTLTKQLNGHSKNDDSVRSRDGSESKKAHVVCEDSVLHQRSVSAT